MTTSSHPTRIVVAGGGFGGAYVARRLEQVFRKRPEVEVVLVSRDNFFLVTPFLFEACSGNLAFRHCSVPLRAFLIIIGNPTTNQTGQNQGHSNLH